MCGNPDPAAGSVSNPGRDHGRRHRHGGLPSIDRRSNAGLFEIHRRDLCDPGPPGFSGCSPGAPPGPYPRLLAINQPAANAVVFVMGCFVLALIVHAIVTWRGGDPWAASSAVSLMASVLLLAVLVAAFWPLAGATPDRARIALMIAASAAVLGAATTAMLLGHWYLVTP